MNRAQRIARQRAERAGRSQRDTPTGQPEWMARETPAQRREREFWEARQSGPPVWIEHPEVSPVYADDGRLVSWRPGPREREQTEREIEAFEDIRATDWLDDLDMDDMFADVPSDPDERLVWYLQNEPHKIADLDTAKRRGHHRVINNYPSVAKSGSIVTEPRELLNV